MKKNILIVGSSSGIGRCLAEELSKDSKYNVICSSRSIESVDWSLGVNSFTKNVDVASEDSVANLFNYIEKKFNNLYAIINCAGYVSPSEVSDTTYENWDTTIRVNLGGAFLIAKYGIPLLRNSDSGRIINIASTAGLSARPGWSAYAAAKAGVINFSLTLAEELMPLGIRVFCVCPGRTATPLRKILAPKEDPLSIMQPNAVAEVLKNLLEDKNNILEGQPIIVRDRYHY